MRKHLALAIMLFTALPAVASAADHVPERVCTKPELAGHLFKHIYGTTWVPMGAPASVDYIAFNNSESIIGHFSRDLAVTTVRTRMAEMIQGEKPRVMTRFRQMPRPYSINPHQCFIATGNIGSPYDVQPGDLILSNGGRLASSQIYRPVPGGI